MELETQSKGLDLESIPALVVPPAKRKEAKYLSRESSVTRLVRPHGCSLFYFTGWCVCVFVVRVVFDCRFLPESQLCIITF